MSLNLHTIARGMVGAINSFIPVSLRVSTGSAPDASYQPVPTYASPVTVSAQVQPMTWRDIQQLDGLNLQGTRYKIYLNGQIDGLNRPHNKGGDLITFPNGDVYLVAQVLEGWFTAGWCSVAATLQNGS